MTAFDGYWWVLGGVFEELAKILIPLGIVSILIVIIISLIERR